MELKSILRFTVILIVFAAATVSVNAARRVILRPLSAQEVVRILKLAGREDAIPEGRVVTRGLAAMTGFALGLAKGIGGSLLFDLATSNATSQFINNFNVTGMMGDYQGINMTALTQMFSWGFGNKSSEIRYKTTEICFNTRTEEPVVEKMARQVINTSPAIATGTTDERYSDSADADDSDTGVTDDAAIDNRFDTDSAEGDDINTKSKKDTQTGNDSSQTCIVIQKPIMRKRRSSDRKHSR